VLGNADGSFAVVGETQDAPQGDRHAYFLRISGLGQVQRSQTYFYAPHHDYLCDIAPLIDGSGYVMCGGAEDRPTGFQMDGFTMQTNLNGVSDWMQQFGGSGQSEQIRAFTPAADGGYLVAGRLVVGSATRGDGLLTKLNDLGEVQWSRTYGDLPDDGFNRVRTLQDGSFAAIGYTHSWGAGGRDMYFIHVSDSGDSIMARALGGGAEDVGQDLLPLPNGGYMLAGWTYSTGHGSADGYLVRLNPQGDVMWQRTYGSDEADYFMSIAPGPQGGFVLAGGSNSFGEFAHNRVYLVGVDSSGNELWHKVYGPTQSTSWAEKVIATRDGSYLLVGTVLSEQTGNDVYVIRTGPLVISNTEDQPPAMPTEFNLAAYPNPFNPATTLQFSLPVPGQTVIQLFNAEGQLVQRISDGFYSAGAHVVTVDGSHLASGTYFARLSSGPTMITRRLLLVK
jgi:hypothetical protein